MNPPNNHTTPPSDSEFSRRDFTRLVTTALVGAIPVGLASCASSPTKIPKEGRLHEVPGNFAAKLKAALHRHGHRHGHGMHTMAACAKFVSPPTHDKFANVDKDEETLVTITVKWQKISCNLGTGVVSVFLVKANAPSYYCGKQTFTATSNQTTKQLTFSVIGGSSLGQHQVKCYITGTATDGSAMELDHDGVGNHCPLP